MPFTSRRGAASVGTVTVMLVSVSCSDSSEPQCVNSGEAQICYVTESPVAGFLEVRGLRPGSTLTLSLPDGDATYRVNDAGSLDGKLGVVSAEEEPLQLTVTATTAAGESLTGTFDS
jgi:hypothetical protein